MGLEDLDLDAVGEIPAVCHVDGGVAVGSESMSAVDDAAGAVAGPIAYPSRMDMARHD